MKKKNKVIVAGLICLDITPVFPSNEAVKLDQILVPGKLIQMGAADVHAGGCVANTGLAMKLFGAEVILVGRVGQDSFGQSIENILKEYHVQDGLIKGKDTATSYSVVIAPPGVDRIFLHHPGANNTFCGDDIKDELLEEAVLFHFGYPPLMKRMFECQGKELIHLFQRVKLKGLITSLDMAAIDEKSEAAWQDWKAILTELIPYIDIFAPSAEELCYMLEPGRYHEWNQRAAGRDVTEILCIEEDIAPLGEQLIKMGAKIVLIKCGAPGFYYRTASEPNILSISNGILKNPESWADRSGFEKSYIPDCLLSANGAGDTTIAAFLTAAMNQYPFEQCLQLAAAAGASCVTEYDALSGLKSFPELEEKISCGWLKVHS